MSRKYLVRFFKRAEKKNDKDEYLGEVEVDDTSVSNSMPLAAKAFKQAPPRCLMADKLKIIRQ